MRFTFSKAVLGSILLHTGLVASVTFNWGSDQIRYDKPLTIKLRNVEKVSPINAAPKKTITEKKEIVKQLEEKKVEEPKPVPKKIIKKSEPTITPKRKPKPKPVPKLKPKKKIEAVQKQSIAAERVSSVAQATYAQLLADWLERYKRYPRRALKRGVEGEILLKVKILKTGEVVTSQIEKGSGSDLLDGEGLQMVARANPFPEIPSEFNSEKFEFKVPVVFKIG